jgi:DNA topoisomerase-1
MASLMSPCQKESTLVRIVNNKTKFYTHSSKTIFDGFRKVYSFDKSDEEDALIPTMLLKVGKKLKSKKIEVKEVVTLPPPRYNQASLIKALEESGVGRPSTYSSMAKKPLERGYVVLESKVYKMTEVGNRVVEMVDDYFNDVINVDFTKNMEEHLDDIAHKDEK